MKKTIIYLLLLVLSLATVLLIGCAPSLDKIKAEEFVGRHVSDALDYYDKSRGSHSLKELKKEVERKQKALEFLYELLGEEPPREVRYKLPELPPGWRIYKFEHYHPEDPKFESCTIEFLADENDYILKIGDIDCKKR